ncbi:MAG: LolA-related protein [Lautropia sp.]
MHSRHDAALRVVAALPLAAVLLAAQPASARRPVPAETAAPVPAATASPVPAATAAPVSAETAAPAPAGAVPTLESLLARIGGKPQREARFRERKFMAVLDRPVESSGVLRFTAPGRLERITERPRRELMMLDGDTLVVERDGRRRSIAAAQLPGVAALVGALRDTLAGDAQALRRLFRVVVQGSDEAWQIDLLPSDTSAAELVARITLRGRGDQLAEIETFQADGDRSVLQIE